MPVKFLGCSGEPPILSENSLKSFMDTQTGCPENKHENVNYVSDFVAPLVDRIENSRIFFDEAEYQ